MTTITFLGLAGVEEAGGEEDDGYDKGDAGVEEVVVAETEEGVAEPCCEAYEPDPRCFSQHRQALQNKVAAWAEQARFAGLVLH